jgi:hypothetical protein
MIYNNVLAKDLSFYIYELQQKKQKMDDIEKELHVELKNKSLEDLKKKENIKLFRAGSNLLCLKLTNLEKKY